MAVIDTFLKEGSSFPAYMDIVYTPIKTLDICVLSANFPSENELYQ